MTSKAPGAFESCCMIARMNLPVEGNLHLPSVGRKASAAPQSAPLGLHVWSSTMLMVGLIRSSLPGFNQMPGDTSHYDAIILPGSYLLIKSVFHALICTAESKTTPITGGQFYLRIGGQMS